MQNDLNALVGSRICHDLISPIGAIGNGVELLTMSGHGASPEMALISQAVENANARIRFFRIAYGAASPGALVGEAEIHSILKVMHQSSRIDVQWRAEGDIPRDEVKLAFLLLQCLESALPVGGHIFAARGPSGWQIEARGDKFKTDDALWKRLNASETDSSVAASDVHFALAPEAAKLAGRAVAVYIGDDRITLSF